MEKRIKLPAEEQKYFDDIDRSILHWSTKYAKDSIALKKMEGQIDVLYQTRERHLNKIIQDAGVDPDRIVRARVDPETGTLVVGVPDAPDAPDRPPTDS